MGQQYSSKPGGTSLIDSASLPASATPGKRTLIDQLAVSPALIQRKAAPSSEAAETGPETITTAQASGGDALSGAVRSRFEHSLGTGLGDVRVHSGAPSAAAADSVQARAFTVGSDIHFGAGQYDPSSRSGQELLAHEVAHTVQQRGAGATTQYKLDVSSPGDASEMEADRAASAMIDGAPASVSRVGAGVFRKASDQQPPAANVGGQTDGIPVENQEKTGKVQVGGAGYSRQMMRSTAELAGEIAATGTVQDLLLKPVAPVLTGVDKAIDTRQHDVQRMDAWKDSAGGVFYHGQTMDEAALALGWVKQHMQTLIGDRDDEEQKFQAFNTWVPQANAFYASMTRLQAQMDFLGVGNNVDGMIAAIRQQIGMPPQDAQPAQGDQPEQPAQHATGAQAVGARAVDAGAPLPVPPTDDTVTQAGMLASADFKKMQTAFLGVQQNLHAQRVQDVNSQGDAARGRLDEINQVKGFLHSVGGAIDQTAGVVNGAPAAISNATDLINRTGAKYGAVRNKRALMRGEAQRWNPTYTTLDEHGAMVIRNVQTGMDVNPAIEPGKDGRRTPSPGANEDTFTMPTSIGGAVDAIANFAFGAEIRELTELLDSIEARCTGEKVQSEFLETVKRVRTYRDALNAYAVSANHLQQRIAERRQQYLTFGEQMDAFAGHSRASQQAGEAPAAGHERYATVFALISSIREVTAAGRIALTADDVPDWHALQLWYKVLRAHRNDNGQPDPLSGYGEQSSIQGFEIPQGETDAITSFGSQAGRFKLGAQKLITQLTPIDAATQELFAQLHAGGGTHAY